MSSYFGYLQIRVDPSDDPLKTMRLLKNKYVHIFHILEGTGDQNLSLVTDYKKLILAHLSHKSFFTPQLATAVIHLPDLSCGFRMTASSDPDYRLHHSEISSKRLPDFRKFFPQYKNAVRSFVNLSRSLEFDVVFCEKRESFLCSATGLFKRHGDHLVSIEMSMAKDKDPVFRRQCR